MTVLYLRRLRAAIHNALGEAGSAEAAARCKGGPAEEVRQVREALQKLSRIANVLCHHEDVTQQGPRLLEQDAARNCRKSTTGA